MIQVVLSGWDVAWGVVVVGRSVGWPPGVELFSWE